MLPGVVPNGKSVLRTPCPADIPPRAAKLACLMYKKFTPAGVLNAVLAGIDADPVIVANVVATGEGFAATEDIVVPAGNLVSLADILNPAAAPKVSQLVLVTYSTFEPSADANNALLGTVAVPDSSAVVVAVEVCVLAPPAHDTEPPGAI